MSTQDIETFAKVTGDYAPVHMSDEFVATTRYGKRIAHGVLVLGFVSTASTEMAKRVSSSCVSYGYDHVRFTAPVFVGDEFKVKYTVVAVDMDKGRLTSQVRVIKEDGQVCVVAQHMLQCV